MTVRPSGLGDPEDDVARMRDAISDIRPPPFRDQVDQLLQESTMAPGLLTRLASQVTSRDAAPEKIDRHVVGVQLFYEGLTLTRALAGISPSDDEREYDASFEILVAEVLVARGFSFLSRTEVASDAVEIVRAFGRDETNRRVGRPDSVPPDRSLEADVFELSIVAGVTATDADPPTGTREFAMKLAESMDDELDDGNGRFSEAVVEELDALVLRDE